MIDEMDGRWKNNTEDGRMCNMKEHREGWNKMEDAEKVLCQEATLAFEENHKHKS